MEWNWDISLPHYPPELTDLLDLSTPLHPHLKICGLITQRHSKGKFYTAVLVLRLSVLSEAEIRDFDHFFSLFKIYWASFERNRWVSPLRKLRRNWSPHFMKCLWDGARKRELSSLLEMRSPTLSMVAMRSVSLISKAIRNFLRIVLLSMVEVGNFLAGPSLGPRRCRISPSKNAWMVFAGHPRYPSSSSFLRRFTTSRIVSYTPPDWIICSTSLFLISSV